MNTSVILKHHITRESTIKVGWKVKAPAEIQVYNRREAIYNTTEYKETNYIYEIPS
jgi:hypothetical protein